MHSLSNTIQLVSVMNLVQLNFKTNLIIFFCVIKLATDFSYAIDMVSGVMDKDIYII